MRFSLSVAMVFIVVALAGGVFGLGLYQWLTQDSEDVQRQADAGREAAEDWARGQLMEIAPEFTLTDRDGQLRSSDEWAGQVRVVNFWATWCAPCREEVPLLVDLQREYAEQGVTVLGIALDEPDAVHEFADEFNINYPVLVGEQEARALAEQFGSDRLGLPHTIVVNREGEIVGFHLGLMNREDIAPLLESLVSEVER